MTSVPWNQAAARVQGDWHRLVPWHTCLWWIDLATAKVLSTLIHQFLCAGLLIARFCISQFCLSHVKPQCSPEHLRCIYHGRHSSSTPHANESPNTPPHPFPPLMILEEIYPPCLPFITILHPPFHSPNAVFHLNAVSMKHAPNISSLSRLLCPGCYTFPVLAIEWMVFNSHTLYIPAPFMGWIIDFPALCTVAGMWGNC